MNIDPAQRSVKVSIVVPIFNVSPFLPKCLDSLLAQTSSNWEAVLVDDGSTDTSPEICQRYARIDPRFRYYSQLNQGQGLARNRGIELSEGEYIVFVDPDDWIHSQMVQEMSTYMAGSDVDFVSFGLEYVDEGGRTLRRFSRFQSDRLVGRSIFRCALIDKEVLSSPCNKIYRKSFLIEQEIKFPALRAYEDLFFSRLLSLKARRCSFVDRVYYFALARAGSTTRSASARRAHQALELMVLEKTVFWRCLVDDEERNLFNAHLVKFVGQIAFHFAFGFRSREEFLEAHSVLFQSEPIKEVGGEYRSLLPLKNRMIEPLARRPLLLWFCAKALALVGIRPY
jgi:glycosyltransferase involved in cell wall biosynthesis